MALLKILIPVRLAWRRSRSLSLLILLLFVMLSTLLLSTSNAEKAYHMRDFHPSKGWLQPDFPGFHRQKPFHPPLDHDEDKRAEGSAIHAEDSAEEQDGEGPFVICPQCDETDMNGYARLGLASSIQGDTMNARLVRHLERELLLKSWQEPVFMSNDSALGLYRNYLSRPDEMLSLSVNNLTIEKPTMYIYTRTGPSSKAGQKGRYRGLADHGKSLWRHIRYTRERGFQDGTLASERQILWIVIEDNSRIDPQLTEVLQQSGIDYVYFAHGPTRKFGKAQWNMALETIKVVRDAFFGNGPVYNIDDDSRVLPELFDRLWKVQRAIFWPVGNIFWDWEGPRTVAGKQVAWPGWSTNTRKFPIDMNGFAINSSLLGDVLKGPKYTPNAEQAGEDSFLQTFLKDKNSVENLCEDTLEERCYFVWHNWIYTPADAVWDHNTQPEWQMSQKPAWFTEFQHQHQQENQEQEEKASRASSVGDDDDAEGATGVQGDQQREARGDSASSDQ